jgi:hypothetical protein
MIAVVVDSAPPDGKQPMTTERKKKIRKKTQTTAIYTNGRSMQRCPNNTMTKKGQQ